MRTLHPAHQLDLAVAPGLDQGVVGLGELGWKRQKTPHFSNSSRSRVTTSARSIASSRFFFKNAAHCVFFASSSEKPSPNPGKRLVVPP